MAKTHGYGNLKNPTYGTYMRMRARCFQPSNASYKNYGAKGLTVCGRWMEPQGRGFLNFLADMGERPAGMSIDRLDNSNGYSPENCRWADSKTQGSNRRCVAPITFNGRTQNAEDWARELGLKPQNIRSRIDRGWPLDRVLTQPSKGRRAFTKVTPTQVQDIRALAQQGLPASKIQRKHPELGYNAIYEIVRGRTWKQL